MVQGQQQRWLRDISRDTLGTSVEMVLGYQLRQFRDIRRWFQYYHQRLLRTISLVISVEIGQGYQWNWFRDISGNDLGMQLPCQWEMGATGRQVGNLESQISMNSNILNTRRLPDTYNFSYLLTLVALISYLSINPSYFVWITSYLIYLLSTVRPSQSFRGNLYHQFFLNLRYSQLFVTN